MGIIIESVEEVKEQNSLEKSNIRFVCLNEAICPIIPQRLADQKAKIRELIKKSFPCINGICGGCNNRNGDTEFLKEFEELKI